MIRKAIDYKLNGNPIANAKRRKKQEREAAEDTDGDDAEDEEPEPADEDDEPAADQADDDEALPLQETRNEIRNLLIRRGPLSQSDIRGATMLAMSEIVDALNHGDFKQLPNGRWALRQHGSKANTRKEAT